MADLEIKFDVEKFVRAMREAPDELYSQLRKRMPLWFEKWIGRTKRENLRGGNHLQTRSGSLARSSLVTKRGHDLDSLRVVAGFTAKYAPIQEHGGTILPTNSKYLTIPLDRAKTAAGVTRKPARQWDDTFFLFRGGKSPLIMLKEGDKVTPLFVLAKSVKIPGNFGFYDSWRRNKPSLFRELGKAVDVALDTVAA